MLTKTIESVYNSLSQSQSSLNANGNKLLLKSSDDYRVILQN
jgi:hypothetical protein